MMSYTAYTAELVVVTETPSTLQRRKVEYVDWKERKRRRGKVLVDSEAGEDETAHENARILVSISPQVQVRVAQACCFFKTLD